MSDTMDVQVGMPPNPACSVMLDLPKGKIHLWLVFDDETVDESLLAHYRRRLLSDDERQQEQRFYFEKDRRQYLVTRALVRTVLSRYSKVSPEAWNFRRNAYGRPEIINEESCASALSFNLSHTDGLILLGVTRTQSLGVDAENLNRKNAPLDIADQFFSPWETEALYAISESIRTERFFHYWTLKESYVKARGQGLSIPLDQFGFVFPDEQSILAKCDPALETSLSDWRFWLLGFGMEHVVAVCASRAAGTSQEILVRKVIPLVSEARMECTVLRQSA
jgi:4'-phosphopantetheinyl transferase